MRAAAASGSRARVLAGPSGWRDLPLIRCHPPRDVALPSRRHHGSTAGRSRAFVAARPSAGSAMTTAEQQQRGEQQHHRDGRGADLVAGLDLVADEDRGDWSCPACPPAKIRTEPNSPSARAKASATPAARPGRRLGKMIRRKIVKPPAPSEAAASSISRSISISSGCTARTTKGRVTKQQGDDDGGPGEGDVDPERAVAAVEREQGEAGDDRRQREGQVDDRVDAALPGKSSRTRSQAMIVPKTPLIATTISEADHGQFQASRPPAAR